MNLDTLDHVTMLRNHRKRAQELRRAAVSGAIDMRLAFEGSYFDVFSVISADHVRAAICEACTNFIVEKDCELEKLGVHVPDREPEILGDAETWKREAGMFQKAWRRELGAHFRGKSHLIDALVVSTRDLVEKVEGSQRTPEPSSVLSESDEEECR